MIKLILFNLNLFFKAKKNIFEMLFFTFIILIIFIFSFESEFINLKQNISGIFWISSLFGSTTTIFQSFSAEINNKVIDKIILSPISLTKFVFSKIISNFIIILMLQLFIFPLMIVFFNININFSLFWLIIIIFTGNFGYVLISTFFSSLIFNEKNVLFSILIYPLLIPLLISIVKLIQLLLINSIDNDFYFWLNISVGFNLIYLFLIIILSEFAFN